MQPIDQTASRYDRLTIALHWLVAFLVVEQWIGAQVIDFFPRGAPRVDARSVHIAGGVLLGVLLLIRVLWRGTGGRRLPASDVGIRHTLAVAIHGALYLLVAAMIGVGLALTLARGDSIFNLFTLPRFATNDLADTIQEVHATIGYLILGTAGLHALAALVHHYILKDGVLRRMLPR